MPHLTFDPSMPAPPLTTADPAVSTPDVAPPFVASRDAATRDEATGEATPDSTPLDTRDAAQHWIDTRLSTPVPAHSQFPHEVLPGWKLNFDNFRSTIDQLAAHLTQALPEDAASSAALRAIADIPERLNLKVRHWYERNAGHATRQMPCIEPDQFNLLVADEFRRASKIAMQLARNPRATSQQREAASALAALCQALKRVHYASNVQDLYKASGQRALPMLASYGDTLRPGFSHQQSAEIGVRGGAGFSFGKSLDLDVAMPLGFERGLEVSVASDGDLLVSRSNKPSIGIGASAEFGVGERHRLCTASAELDLGFTLGDQIKVPHAEQAYMIHGERNKYESNIITSASRTRRGLTEKLANVGNGLAGRIVHRKDLFDPFEPGHANADKQMKGMYIEPVIHDLARALDRARDPSINSAGEATPTATPTPAQGPIELLLCAAYPSTKQRIAAMRDPAHWTAEGVKQHLPGPNQVAYGRMPRNAAGLAKPVRAPLMGVNLKPVVTLEVGPTQTFIPGGSAASDSNVGLGESTSTPPEHSPRFALPSVSLEVAPGDLYDKSVNLQTRLAPVVDLMNIGLAGDFAGVLEQLEQVQRHYDASAPPGTSHPHLTLMTRYDAMKQATLTLSPSADGASDRMPPGLEQDRRIYGDPRHMPASFGIAIDAMRQRQLPPVALLRQIDSNLLAFAHQDAQFKADSTEAWAHRGTPHGARLLQSMNWQYFGGAVPLPRKPRDIDYSDFVGRAYDAHALTLCNLGAQRSVTLREGARLLADADVAEQTVFQRIADAGSAVYKARVAAHNEHNLPLIKDQAFRNSSVAAVVRIERKEREASVELGFDAGILATAALLARLPSIDTSHGTAEASLAFTATRQLASTDPLGAGRFLNVSATLEGGFPFPQLAMPLVEAALKHERTAGAARNMPRALIKELANAPLTVPFGQSGGRFEAQWRLPPDAAGSHADTHGGATTERALQYWRGTKNGTMQIGGATPNLLQAVPPGALKISAGYKSSITEPLWQENGWCPALNVLEWNSYLRPLMFDSEAKRPLPFEQIAANMTAAPYEATKHFSRFNPTLLVPEQFRRAVANPAGPRNEFHRMLYDADGQSQRDFSPDAVRYAPDTSHRLFGQPPARGVFDTMIDEARQWPPVEPARLEALADMTTSQRLAWFTGTSEGQAHLQRYMALMELAGHYNEQGKKHGRGYALTVNAGLVASRAIVNVAGPASGDKPTAAARLSSHIQGAARGLRLRAEDPSPRATADTRAILGVSPTWAERQTTRL